MPDPTTDPDGPDDRDVSPEANDSAETPHERAEEIYEEVSAENPDPVTRREAIEGELEQEGLSDEGEELGEHNE
ncbi:MAG TPA: hypothetical protein VJM49_14565 [Acidimicrobiales bacterium]|nr:hypothetical protein [Acidimicrobiales bacterium]